MGKHYEKFLLLREAGAEYSAAAEPRLAGSITSKCSLNFVLQEPPCAPRLPSSAEYSHTQLLCLILGWAQLWDPSAFLFDVCICI